MQSQNNNPACKNITNYVSKELPETGALYLKLNCTESFYSLEKHVTSPSCLSVMSTPSNNVLSSDTAPAESSDVSNFEKLSLTTDDALPRLSATSKRSFAKFCCYQKNS